MSIKSGPKTKLKFNETSFATIQRQKKLIRDSKEAAISKSEIKGMEKILGDKDGNK